MRFHAFLLLLQWSHALYRPHPRLYTPLLSLRGGDEELSLDEKVRKAMLKLGLTPPPMDDDEETQGNDVQCEGGVCKVEPVKAEKEEESYESTKVSNEEGADAIARRLSEKYGGTTAGAQQEQASEQVLQQNDNDADTMAARLANKYKVNESLALAAIGATATVKSDGSRVFNETAAAQLIHQEVSRIQEVSEDSPQVQQLIQEGFDPFLSRRALAFADMNLEDARAILLADQMDEQEEDEQEKAAAQSQQAPKEVFKTVTVDSNFDPTQTMTQSREAAAPKPAQKSQVVFEATSAQIQELVLESPVPVILDIYADWCGPCKMLGPILEEMAVKGGGAFRLVKVNSDNERPVSGALEVTALPTVFGLKDGKIKNMFQGMPRSQEAMKSFLMGLLVSESHFDPPVSAKQQEKFDELTSKLVKMASSACFSFSARERLQDRVSEQLDKLANQASDFVEAEEATQLLKRLLSNVIRDPYESKFRSVNLANKVIAAKVTKFPPCIAILKSVGFAASDKNTMIMGKGKKIVNVAPLLVARDCIDKWLAQTRYEVAKAARKRKDEEARVKLQEEAALQPEEEEEDVEEEETVDPDACTLKVRMEGKKKVHEVPLRADDPLNSVLEHLPVAVEDDDEVQITCVARKLVIKSRSDKRMGKSLRSLGLAPSAALVITVGGTSADKEATKTKLSERAAAKQKRKKGSHTMQSVGIYSKDDNAKGELIDMGGGVWYEHDVTDDEEEEKAEANEDQADSGDAAVEDDEQPSSDED